MILFKIIVVLHLHELTCENMFYTIKYSGGKCRKLLLNSIAHYSSRQLASQVYVGVYYIKCSENG